MDGYMVGILALGATSLILFFGVKIYDHFRDGDRDHSQHELFHEGQNSEVR